MSQISADTAEALAGMAEDLPPLEAKPAIGSAVQKQLDRINTALLTTKTEEERQAYADRIGTPDPGLTFEIIDQMGLEPGQARRLKARVANPYLTNQEFAEKERDRVERSERDFMVGEMARLVDQGNWFQRNYNRLAQIAFEPETLESGQRSRRHEFMVRGPLAGAFDLGNAVYRGSATGVSLAADAFGSDGGVLRRWARELDQVSLDGRRSITDLAEPTREMGVIGDFAVTVGRATPQMVVATGAALMTANPYAGVAVFAGTNAAPVAANAYDESLLWNLERGMDPKKARERAQAESLGTGALVLATSAIPGSVLFGKAAPVVSRAIAAGTQVRSLRGALAVASAKAVRKHGAAAVAEGTQEAVEEIGQDLLAQGFRKDYTAFEQGWLQRLGMAFTVGAFMGGAASVAVEAVTKQRLRERPWESINELENPVAYRRARNNAPAMRWAAQNPTAARELINRIKTSRGNGEAGVPSKQDFKDVDLPSRWTAEERAEFARDVERRVGQEKAAGLLRRRLTIYAGNENDINAAPAPRAGAEALVLGFDPRTQARFTVAPGADPGQAAEPLAPQQAFTQPAPVPQRRPRPPKAELTAAERQRFTTAAINDRNEIERQMAERGAAGLDTADLAAEWLRTSLLVDQYRRPAEPEQQTPPDADAFEALRQETERLAEAALALGGDVRQLREPITELAGRLEEAGLEPEDVMVPAPEAPAEPEPALPTEPPPPPVIAPAEAAADVDADAERGPDMRLADWVSDRLNADQPFTARELFQAADAAWGGTRAEGIYGPSDAYDAMELGVHRHLLGQTLPHDIDGNPVTPAQQAAALDELLGSLPTQTNRSGEKDSLQQFSTPPQYAFAAAWMANINGADTVLEPSAGTGGLLVHMINAQPAAVHVNELSGRRAKLLADGFDVAPTRFDAEHLNAILAPKLPSPPTVVVMNPPFSNSGTRNVTKDTRIGAKHIEAALKTLAPGGRLVAITGDGMRQDAPRFRDWWARIGEEYNVRANIGIRRDTYKKYGTSFPTRLLVIDKAEPDGVDPVILSDVSVAELVTDSVFKGVRDDRPRQVRSDQGDQRAAAEPDGAEPAPARLPERRSEPEADAADAVRGRGERSERGVEGGARSPDAGGAGLGADRPGRPVGDDSAPDAAPRPEPAAADPAPDQAGDDAAVPDGGGRGAGRAGDDRGRPAEQPDGDRARAEARDRVAAPITDSLFVPHTPEVIIDGAQPHMSPMVETAAMGAVEAPPITYRPFVTPDALAQGTLSDMQIEQVARAGQAHEGRLQEDIDGTPLRRGYLVGHGTGSGKGHIIAGVVTDNWNAGRRRVVWSGPPKLFPDAKEALGLVGGPVEALRDIRDTKLGDALPDEDGVLFVPYSVINSKDDSGEFDRLKQVQAWLGDGFDGVIAFDEAHEMGNVGGGNGRGSRKGSATALAGMQLQRDNPDARVLYASATAGDGAAKIQYAERLGVWGRGTPFATAQEFVSQIGQSVSNMEAVTQSMKANGVFGAARLSYDDVVVENVEATVSDDFATMYDVIAKSWQSIADRIVTQLAENESDTAAKAAVASRIWGFQQRLFKQVINASKVATIAESARADLEAGRSVVVQLDVTYEASLNRALGDRKSGASADDVDLTPRAELMSMVESAYPVQQFETYVDEYGNESTRAVREDPDDPDSPVVLNPDAVAAREALLDELGSLNLPEMNPIDALIEALGGPDKVAEVTGRSRRIVSRENEDTGRLERVVDRRGPRAADADINAFQDGKKRVLLFSRAGNTGKSYHADRRRANQQQRVHYLMDGGWSSIEAVQGLGRAHRSNQASAPIIRMVQSPIIAERRFLATIARRLATLGAVSSGQRQAGAGGVFDGVEDIDSSVGRDAFRAMVVGVHRGEFDGLTIEELEQITGLSFVDENGMLKDEMPQLTKFLNRMLSMTLEQQQRYWTAFETAFESAHEAALRSGELDTGVETLAGDDVTVLREEDVYEDDQTGAKVRYMHLKVRTAVEPLGWDAVAKGSGLGGRTPTDFYRNLRSGRVWAARPQASRIDTKTGSIVEQVMVNSPNNNRRIEPKPAFENETKFEKIGRDEARTLWEQQAAEVEPFNERDVHVATGAIANVWNRFVGDKAKMVRLQPTGRPPVLGRWIPPSRLETTLRQLGATANAVEIATPDMHRRLVSGAIKVQMSNNYVLVRKRVQNEPRIELQGHGPSEVAGLVADGVIRERIGFDTRLFVPTGEAGIAVLEKVRSRGVVTEVINADEDASVLDQRLDTIAPSRPNPAKADRTQPFGNGPRARYSPASPHRAEDIVRTMSRDFGVNTFERAPTRAQASGQFYVNEDFIALRSRFGGDIAVQTHEVFHHIDRVMHPELLAEVFSREAKAELRRLDYQTNRPDRKLALLEGFAEFGRHLIFEGDADEQAPTAFREFVEWLDGQPVLRRKLQKTERLVREWHMGTGPGHVAVAMSGGRYASAEIIRDGDPWVERVIEPIGSAYAYADLHLIPRFVDDVRLIDKFDSTARKRGLDPADGDTAAAMIRAYRKQGPTMAMAMLNRGVYSLNDGRMLSKPLLPVLRELVPAKDFERWEQWIAMRSGIEAYEKSGGQYDFGVDIATARAFVEENHSDTFERAHDAFMDWRNAIIQMAADAGLISEAEAHTITNKWERLAPLWREQTPVFTATMNRVRGMKRASGLNMGSGAVFSERSTTISTPGLRGRSSSGSFRRIVSPMHAAFMQAAVLAEAAAQQKVINALVEAQRGVGGLSDWITPAERATAVQSVDLAALKSQLVELGLDESEIDGVLADEEMKTTLFLFKPYWTAGKDSDAVVQYREQDGTQRFYSLAPETTQVLKNMQYQHVPFWVRALQFPGRIVRMGRTGVNPAFTVRNFSRDYAAFLNNSQYANIAGWRQFTEPARWLIELPARGIWSFATGRPDPLLEMFTSAGVLQSTELGMDVDDVRRLRQRIYDRNIGRRFKHRFYGTGLAPNPLTVLNGVQEMLVFAELAPRMAEFVLAMKANGYSTAQLVELWKKGERPPERLMRIARNAAADVTADWGRQGLSQTFAAYQGMVPFQRAALQSWWKYGRNWKNNTKRATAFHAFGVALASLHWLAWEDDEWYQNAAPWIRYREAPIDLPYFGETDKPDFRVPLAHEIGFASYSFPRFIFSAISAMGDDNPEALRRELSLVGQGFVDMFGTSTTFRDIGGLSLLGIPLTPSAVAPIMDVAANWDSFGDRPLESRRLEYRAPQDRHTWRTSEFSIGLGQALGVSPIKIDHLLSNYSGGMFDTLFNNRGDTVGRKLWNLTLGGVTFRAEYTWPVGSFYAKADTLRGAYNGGRLTEHADLVAHEKAGTVRSMLSRFRDATPRNLTRGERYEYDKWQTGAARAWLGLEEHALFPNPLGDTEGMPEPLQEVRSEFVSLLRARARRDRPSRRRGERLDAYTKRVDRWRVMRDAARELLNP